MKTKNKPGKPYPEFPLFAHPNGQWAKKIQGKVYYFGLWSDADEALQDYMSRIDGIRIGRDPKQLPSGVDDIQRTNLAEMFNIYLSQLDKRQEKGEVTTRYFNDMKKACKLVTKHFGRTTAVAVLKAADFTSLIEGFPQTWGPYKIGTEVQRIRTAFKWAAESELIDRMPNFGPSFKKPSKPQIRRANQQRQSAHGTLDFTANEIRLLLANTDGWLKACILLGINGGFGASDCGRLKQRHIDFTSGWHDLPRAKTGIRRRFPVWKQTCAAISHAMSKRGIPANSADDDLCFLTSHGRPVWWQTEKGTNCDNVGKGFRKLCVRLEIHRKGRSFYSLRRTFRTVAGELKDQPAANLMMGHEGNTMGDLYTQSVADDRLQAIASHVEEWVGLDCDKA